MFETLLRRLFNTQPERLPHEDMRRSLAALLIRVARADGLYAATEAERIDRILRQRFNLSPFEATALRVEAETLETEAPDTVRFTRAIKDATELEEREGLLEAMWSVALIDGERDAEEDQLMRMVANLLGLTDVQNAQARSRAVKEL